MNNKIVQLSLGEEFLDLVCRNYGLFEIVSTSLFRTLHSDDLAKSLI